MSKKLNFIPPIPNYDWIREQMAYDLQYRLSSRQRKTSFGRPLYERINVQIIMTQECPYHCPFCLERQNPMKGLMNGGRQIQSLVQILKEHPEARLTITGGEPSLYPDHVKKLVDTYRKNSSGVFVTINTAGYNPDINGLAHINLSVNDYVKPDPAKFPGCTYQNVLAETDMTLDTIKRIITEHPEAGSFSFRFLSDLGKHDYDMSIWNALQADKEVEISIFRVGDFFVYATFNWSGRHARITLGDMYQQQHNGYQNGYSNIIIHPYGRIGTNWR